MANWKEKAVQKRRNRNRIVTLVLVYVMILGLLAGVTFSHSHDHHHGGVLECNLIPIIILVLFTILYWVIFLILIRRSNQRGDK